VSSPEKPRKFSLLLILVAAFAVRAAFVTLKPSSLDYPDEVSYNTVANNFLDGKGLILSDRLKIHRTPGYPLFLAAVYALAGRQNLLAVALIQALVGTASVAVIFLTAARLFDRTAALAAGAIAAAYPFHIYFTPLILTETLFTFLLLALVASLVALATEHSRGRLAAWLAAAACSAGAAVMVKPSVLPLIALMAPAALLTFKPARRGAAVAAALLVGTGVFLAPWAIRNERISGHLVLTTLWTGKSLYEAVGPQADGGPAMDKIRLAEPPGADEYEFNRYYLEQAKKEIRKSPARFFKLALVKFTRFWNIFPNSPAHRAWYHKLISAIFVGPIVAAAIIGVWRNLGAWRAWWPLAAAPLVFTMLHMVFVASVRYRTPVMGCMMVLAVGAFGAVGRKEPHDED